MAVWPSQATDTWTRAVLGWVTGAPGRQEAWLCLYLFVAGRGRTCLALRLSESSPHSPLSCFRFYRCLFSGPSTFIPMVRDLEFVGPSLLASLLVGLGRLPVRRAQAWVPGLLGWGRWVERSPG